jgi:hypothetical protein
VDVAVTRWRKEALPIEESVLGLELMYAGDYARRFISALDAAEAELGLDRARELEASRPGVRRAYAHRFPQRPP